MNEIFTEKYRPKSFEEVVGIDPEIKKLVESKNIPHFLFEGIQGSGKTTISKIIINELDAETLVLNASKDRGIGTIRDRIEPFCKKASSKLKIVFLDEFDATTPAFQTALRNLMETHAGNTRFIATCNYKSKIIPPVISRFSVFTFGRQSSEEVVKYLQTICAKENIKFEQEVLTLLVKKYKADIRSMVNFLQQNKSKEIKVSDIKNDNIIIKILSGLKNKKWFDVRKELLNIEIEYSDIIVQLDYYIFNNSQVPLDVKRKSNIVAAKYLDQLGRSFNPETCFAACMAELEDILQW